MASDSRGRNKVADAQQFDPHVQVSVTHGAWMKRSRSKYSLYLNPTDPHYHQYPRKGFLWFIRAVLLICWTLVVGYLGNAVNNMYKLFRTNPRNVLDWLKVRDALLLPWWLTGNHTSIWMYLISGFGFAVLLLACWWATYDRAVEKSVLELRHIDQKVADEIPPAVMVQVPAAVEQQLPEEVERQLPGVLAQTISGGDSSGAPFELGLLPLPERVIGRATNVAWARFRLSARDRASNPLSQPVAAFWGMAGVGKTALAATVLHGLYDDGACHDGIVVMLCEGRHDTRGVLTDILDRFDRQRRVPRNVDQSLLVRLTYDRLKGKDALVVLDNVEPELKVNVVVDALAAAGIRVLLTGRTVPPLPVVARQEIPLLESGQAEELFAFEHTGADLDTVSADDRLAIEQIVDLLGRHTLAVKLTARYAADAKRTLTVLAEELRHDPLRVPDGDVTRAVELVFQTSIGALAPEARTLFMALAAFAALQFGRDAAVQIAHALGSADGRVPVDALIRRALLDGFNDPTLQYEGHVEAVERLRLHPLLRAIAEKELGRQDSQYQLFINACIGHYYGAYTLRYRSMSLSVRRGVIDVDEKNILHALQWAVEHKRHMITAQICAGMDMYWRVRSRPVDGITYARIGLSAAIGVTRSPRYAPLWLPEKVAVAIRAIPARATSLSSEALVAATVPPEQIGGWIRQYAEYCEYRERMSALYGWMLQLNGQLRRADSRFRRNLRVARGAHAIRGEISALTSLGDVALLMGRFTRAEGYYYRSLAIAGKYVRRNAGEILGALGQIAILRGRLNDATTLLDRAVEISYQEGNHWGVSAFRALQGRLALRMGDAEEAERYYTEALTADPNADEVEDLAGDLSLLGDIALARGDLALATRCFERLQQLHVGQGLAYVLCQDYYHLAQVAQWQGNIAVAKDYFSAALKHSQTIGARYEYARAQFAIGQLAMSDASRKSNGCRAVKAAARAFRQMGVADGVDAEKVLHAHNCSHCSGSGFLV